MQIEQLPDNCIEKIYEYVYHDNYKKVVSELSKEFEEYWKLVGDVMCQDGEYFQRIHGNYVPEVGETFEVDLDDYVVSDEIVWFYGGEPRLFLTVWFELIKTNRWP